MRLYVTILIVLLLNNTNMLLAQNSTFEKLHTIFKSNCTTGCHSGDNPVANLDLTGSLDEVYDRLINTEPINPYANENGFKLVKPGYADKSFLFRKCNNNLYHTSKLDQKEGQLMPIDQPALSWVEIEIMRQWIQEGAPKNGIVDREALITQYYQEDGLPRLEKPAAPNEGEGFQIYFGTVFLAPNEEVEVVKKVKLELEENVEVKRIELFMDQFSHHLIISKFGKEESNQYPDDLQTIGSISDQINHLFNSDFVAITQTDYLDLELPEKTAFLWTTNNDLSINYHVKNYSQSSIFPGEIYMNVYTQDTGVAEREMKSTLHIYGENPLVLNIDNTGRDTTLIMQHTRDEIWDIWILQGHTHQLGVDYDMFLRNENGTKGEQIYEGFYDLDYTFNQGFFDYEHPPVRKFDPLLNVDMNKGLLYEATYNNSGEKPVGFGLTTDDEMFITYLLYAKVEEPISVNEFANIPNIISIDAFPNPFKDETNISYTLNQISQVDLSLYNIMGRKVHQLQSGKLPANNYSIALSKDVYNLNSGMYLLKLSTEHEIVEKKILVFD